MTPQIVRRIQDLNVSWKLGLSMGSVLLVVFGTVEQHNGHVLDKPYRLADLLRLLAATDAAA